MRYSESNYKCVLKTVKLYISLHFQVLRKQPQTVEEIANANSKHNEYMKQTEQMVEMFGEAERKNKTLASWTKERVDQLSRVTMQWDNYKSLMDNHEQIVARQVSCGCQQWW